MSEKCSIPCWIPLRAKDYKELADYTRVYGVDLLPTDSSGRGKPNRIMCLSMYEGEIRASEMLFTVKGSTNEIVTVETQHQHLWPGMACMQAEALGLDPRNYIAVSFVLLNQLLSSLEEVQRSIDRVIADCSIVTHEFVKVAATDMVRGMADMEVLDAQITSVAKPQALILRSLFDIDKVARRIQHHAKPGTHERKLMDELLAIVDKMISNSQYSTERAKFHWKKASTVIEMGNLSVNKIFNVLWAIIIPSQVLINWYGENFRFMPELSWWGTMPAQLIGAMAMTVIPLWLVKNSGAMR